MAENNFKGRIKAKIVEVRFAMAGKLVALNKRKGDWVKKGELLASLDKKISQTQLDKELADFEKVRAEFEIFNLKKGEPTDDITKYLKKQMQADLDGSVKAVEVAKAELDKSDLFAPVEGIMVDDSNLVPGVYLTPASSPFKIIENNSFYFELEIEQASLSQFVNPRPVTVKIPGLEKVIAGQTKPILSQENGKLLVEVELRDKSGLLVGLEGEVGF